MFASEFDRDQMQHAAARVGRIAHRTPVLTSQTFNQLTGTTAFFKCENFQRGGAFKIRGAANFIYSMPKADLARGVVTFSSGNHAQAVAIAAHSVDAPAVIVMPEDAPKAKVAATRGYGARIVHYNRMTEDREALGQRIAKETGATIVPPYDHWWVIQGQSTVASELLDEIPDLDALIVCIGGGGLISGCSLAARAVRADIRIFGVEPELANDTYLSLRAGTRIAIAPPETIADGLRSPSPGKLTFEIIRQNVEDIVLVTEREIRETMRFLFSRMKIVVEPSGAVAAAAVLSHKIPAELRRIGIIISGGNVDLEFLQTLGESG